MKICSYLGIYALLLSSWGCSLIDKKKAANHLRLNITHDPISLDPRRGGDLISSTIQFMLFEGLTKMTPDSVVALGIAERIELSEDQLTYTFYLRDSYWSNGEPLTSDDIVYSWRELLDPNFPCPNAHLFYPIKNAEACKRGTLPISMLGVRGLNPKIIEISLEKPTPFFLEMLSFCVFYPINRDLSINNPCWADDIPNLLCNGPYRLLSWKRGDEILLEKNPLYWNQSGVSLKQIKITIIDNENTALRMYEQGELDLLGLPFTGIPSDSIPSLKEKGILQTTQLPASTICSFNLDAYPFNNIHIRKAFAYAINRQEIVDNITQGSEEAGLYLLPKLLLEDQPPSFIKDGDAISARHHLEQGLRELGITKEELGTITLLYSGHHRRLAQALQIQWLKSLDLPVSLVAFEHKIFLDKLSKRDYQMGLCVWIAQYQDPMNFFERFEHKNLIKNYPGFDNPEYRALLQSSHLQLSNEERFQLLRKAEMIFIEEMPLTAIFHWNTLYLKKDHIENLKLYPSGSFYINEISFSNP